MDVLHERARGKAASAVVAQTLSSSEIVFFKAGNALTEGRGEPESDSTGHFWTELDTFSKCA
jgi:hypothetical protein